MGLAILREEVGNGKGKARVWSKDHKNVNEGGGSRRRTTELGRNSS